MNYSESKSVIRVHRIRLNPTEAQASYFAQCAGIARFTWNWALNRSRPRAWGVMGYNKLFGNIEKITPASVGSDGVDVSG